MGRYLDAGVACVAVDLGLVRFLFGKQLSRNEVLDHVTHARTLTPKQRQRALQFAKEWSIADSFHTRMAAPGRPAVHAM